MQHTTRASWLTAWVVGMMTVLPASGAEAQDYTVTRRESTYQAPPAGAFEPLALPNGMHWSAQMADLPFAFPYYGFAYDEIWISSHGFVQLGVPLGSSSPNNSQFPPNGNEDGMLALAWDYIFHGTVYSWTTGEAP